MHHRRMLGLSINARHFRSAKEADRLRHNRWVSEPVLCVDDLKKTFGPKEAVRGISFSVGSGEAVGLLGPNGAGKTTTLMMLLGAVTPDSGAITIYGYAIPDERAKAMNNVGFAAGYLPMPGRLSVAEGLAFFARLSGNSKPKGAVAEVLDRLAIGHLSKAKADTLSSGQRTLVGIAKAIIHKPKLLILDEPTASLDPDVADRVRQAVGDLNDDGVSLLITSHDMVEVEQLCHRVLLLKAGRILANDNPRALVSKYGKDDLTGVFLHVARDTSQ